MLKSAGAKRHTIKYQYQTYLRIYSYEAWVATHRYIFLLSKTYYMLLTLLLLLFVCYL